MKLKKAIFILMALSMIWIVASPAVGVAAQANSPDALTLNSVYVSTPPVLDGSLNFGEWNYGTNIPFHDGNISVVNDSTRLYVLVDVTGETTNDSSDYFWVTFDTNQNKAIDANKDINYGLPIGTRNMRYQYYLGPSTWTGVTANTYSARGIGFGCFWADGSFSLISFFPLRINCSQHRVWEFGFDLSEIGTFAGGTAKMGVRVSAIRGTVQDDIPANFTNDFTNLILINLAKGPLTIAPFPKSHVGFNQNFNANPVVQPIEVTQATQHTDDSLPLVANKDTVARVSTISPGGAELAKTYLYGSVGGTDLPGSPMVVAQTAPTVYNRLSLTNTANFLLPKSWTGPATVDFSAKAVGLNGPADNAATGSISLPFNTRTSLTVWIVPINTGSVGSPVLPPQSEIDRQESYMRTIYPLSDITFVQKPWQVLGVVPGEPITPLNTYYNNVIFAWIITVLFTGVSPFNIPDEIYGFTPSGGGLSDPIWAGGGGHVGRGFQGTSMEGTMAHETNHNLDKSASGTWGRHVNPGGTGCGAAGPDPSWPYSDPNIHSIGFDTRLPWSTGGGRDTVIPGTFPDIMSYCQSGLLPTKWISDYRWNALFANFAAAGTLAASRLSPTAVSFPNHYYVTGSVSKDKTSGALSGTLDPILVQPGVDNLPPPSNFDNMVINFYGDKGTIIGSVPFFADFTDDPEEPVNTVYFNFSIPQILGPAGPAVITKVTLSNFIVIGQAPTTDLSTINVSQTPLSVGITAPTTPGATLSGSQDLKWSVNNTLSDDTFSILFSNDTGASWSTLASGLHGVDTYTVDTTTLPNTSSPNFARFRVVGTDGFNNSTATTVNLIISNTGTKPTVHITSPLGQTPVSPIQTVTLQGNGSDPTDGTLPDDHLYWYDGAVKAGNELGNGPSIDVNLSYGLHTIYLDGVNTEGTHSTTSIQILIGTPNYLPIITH